MVGRMPPFLRLLGLSCASFLASPALAGEFWLRPDRFNATPGATLAAEIVPWDDAAPANFPAISRSSLTLGGSSVAVGVESGVENQRGPRISATFVRPGWAVWSIDVVLPIQTFGADQLGSRLLLLQAPPALRSLAGSPDSGRTWRLVTLATLKCLARIGEPDPTDQSWSFPDGNAWDLVPKSDPSRYAVGQTTRFAVRASGRPAAGTVVTVRALGEEREIAAPADSDGIAVFQLPTAGLWLASAAHVQVSPANNSQLEVRSVSFVFAVR
jgi:hypothetical protein